MSISESKETLTVNNWDKELVKLRTPMEVLLYKVLYTFENNGYFFTFDGYLKSSLNQLVDERSSYEKPWYGATDQSQDRDEAKNELDAEIEEYRKHIEAGTKIMVFWQTPDMQAIKGACIDDPERPTFDDIFQQWAKANPGVEPFIRQ